MPKISILHNSKESCVDAKKILKEKLSDEHFQRLTALKNEKLHNFVAEAIQLANPQKVYVATDSKEDHDYIRSRAVETKAEGKLAMEGHTFHFDSPKDQARDKANTKYLLPPHINLGQRLNSTNKETGTKEVKDLFKNIMHGKEMLVCFFCLGPTNSDFSIPCVQITDSAYVAHSECILYRPGYEQFKSIAGSEDFFRFLHSEGELDGTVSKNIDKRRVYIDLEENLVYSVNTQYAGNTVGLKKLALRLAIRKSSAEGWLAEHMFIMGAHGPGGRVTYFAGAFPSACGKTSTAMLPGQTIIGDDIAYFRKKNSLAKAVNVEQGIFGIIRDVNPHDDPVIYDALTKPGEVIFGNVLIKDQKPYWDGMGCDIPDEGTNFQGQWNKDKKDPNGKQIPPSHKNARYTVRISALENRDKMADAPEGVTLGAIVYGGRDSDICVPIEQANNWAEGIILKGATIESETTAATLGQEGVRTFNIMSNLDFLSIPLGKYIQNNLDFGEGLKQQPLIFSVNYFLRDEKGKYLNGMLDKKIWILWAELRVNGDVDALSTPTGFIPKYEDLAKLFKENLPGDEGVYKEQNYIRQFSIRVPQLIAKYDRVEKIYRDTVPDTPQIVYDIFEKARTALKQAAQKHGDTISPMDLA